MFHALEKFVKLTNKKTELGFDAVGIMDFPFCSSAERKKGSSYFMGVILSG